uniref:SIS domain-containing protein n=1 Tax=Ignisphaera aggregans TaxID=334771 RepID=A0A7J2U268_9CREN
MEKSEKISEIIVDMLASKLLGKKSIAIMYCGAVEGVARHLETILRISLGETNIIAISGDYAHNMLLPYISDFVEYTILLSSSRSQGCVNRVRQTLRLLGADLLTLLSKPLQESASYAIAEYKDTIEIDENLYRLSINLANIKLGLRIGAESRRIKRMEGETQISNIAKDVLEAYSKAVEATERCSIVVTTHSLLSIGEELSDIGYLYTTVDKVDMYTRFADSIALFYTTAEEHIVREVLTSIRAHPAYKHITYVKINTDPLTAPLYGLLLALYMRLKKLIAIGKSQVMI